MAGHVEDELAPYCEGLLDAARAREIAAHLLDCAACQAAAVEVRRGLEAMRDPPAVELPEIEAARIRRALLDLPAPRAIGSRRWQGLAAAAAVLLALAAVRSAEPPVAPGGPSLHADAGRPTAFEQAALSLHAQHAAGTLALDLHTSSSAEIRRWTNAAGLGVSLAVDRPPEDGDRFVPEGARQLRVGAIDAVAVAYRVDGRPVTLLTARAEDTLDRAPEWTSAGKRVRYRTVGAQKLLAWTNAGQTYALVSELPGYGQRSCLLCHTTRGRRQAIAALRPSSGP